MPKEDLLWLRLNAGELDGQKMIDLNNASVGYMQPSYHFVKNTDGTSSLYCCNMYWDNGLVCRYCGR
jgi:hypothetical protein